MPKDLDRMRSGLAIKPSGPDAARLVYTPETQVKCHLHLVAAAGTRRSTATVSF